MTKRMKEESSKFCYFLTEVIGCVLTGQEVLGGGAKVSVRLLQQLQSVFHRHLHGDIQITVGFKGKQTEPHSGG